MRKARNRLVLLSLFAMYGALMYVSKYIMEGLPNIHPLTMLIVTFPAPFSGEKGRRDFDRPTGRRARGESSRDTNDKDS